MEDRRADLREEQYKLEGMRSEQLIALYHRLHQAFQDNPSPTHNRLLNDFMVALADLPATQSGKAAEVYNALAASPEPNDRSLAAVVAPRLLPGSPREADALLHNLLNDPDETVRQNALDSINFAVENGALSSAVAAKLLGYLDQD